MTTSPATTSTTRHISDYNSDTWMKLNPDEREDFLFNLMRENGCGNHHAKELISFSAKGDEVKRKVVLESMIASWFPDQKDKYFLMDTPRKKNRVKQAKWRATKKALLKTPRKKNSGAKEAKRRAKKEAPLKKRRKEKEQIVATNNRALDSTDPRRISLESSNSNVDSQDTTTSCSNPGSSTNLTHFPNNTRRISILEESNPTCSINDEIENIILVDNSDENQHTRSKNKRRSSPTISESMVDHVIARSRIDDDAEKGFCNEETQQQTIHDIDVPENAETGSCVSYTSFDEEIQAKDRSGGSMEDESLESPHASPNTTFVDQDLDEVLLGPDPESPTRDNLSKKSILRDGDQYYSMGLELASGDPVRAHKALECARDMYVSGKFERFKKAFKDSEKLYYLAVSMDESTRRKINGPERNIDAFNSAMEQLKPGSTDSDRRITLSKEEYDALQKDAQLGRNALNFLSQIGSVHESESTSGGPGRKSDNLQHAYDAVLSSILCPPGEEMLRSLRSIKKDAKTSHPVIQRAQHNRRLLETTSGVRSCLPFQEIRHQKMRIDNIEDLIYKHIHNFCHDSEYVRVDSNCSRTYSVYVPPNGIEEKHVRLNWALPGGLSSQMDHFLNSPYHKALCQEAHEREPTRFNESSKPKIYLDKFKKYICRCLHKKDHAACVDIIEDTVESSLIATKQFISRKTNHRQETETGLMKDFANCTCKSCLDPSKKNWLQILKTDKPDQSILEKALDESLCKKEEFPEYTLESDAKSFRLRAKECSESECENCSISSALPFECPVLSDCNEEQGCWTWEPIEKDSKKRYPQKTKMPVKKIISKLEPELKNEAEHDFHLKFQKRMIKMDMETVDEKDLLIYTDYASNLNHHPPKSECCGHDKHSVLAVYIVLTGRQEVRIENGEKVNYAECDYWFGFVGTNEDGKKSDWVSHHVMLNTIIEHYINKEGRQYENLRVWTDNCPTQYKCRQNFFLLAKLALKFEFRYVEHCFASIYGFKGIWDGLGKIIKRVIFQWEEDHDDHVFTAYASHIVTRNHFALDPWNLRPNWNHEIEKKSIKLKDKNTMQCINRRTVYITDDEQDYRSKKANPLIFIDPARDEAEINMNSRIDQATKDAMISAIVKAARNDIIVFSNREEVMRNEDSNPVKNTTDSFHFKFDSDTFYKAPEMNNEDEALMMKYLASPEEETYTLPSNMAEENMDFINNLRNEFQKPQHVVNCEFCKKATQSNVMQLHHTFCQDNPSNMIFPILHRTRPCFCQRITKADRCPHIKFTGEFNTETELMQLKQSKARKSVERVASLVLTQDKARDKKREQQKKRIEKDRKTNDRIKEHVLELITAMYPNYPNIEGSEQDTITLGDHLDRLSAPLLKDVVSFLKLKVEVPGQDKKKNPKKGDNINAIKNAGGLEAIVRMYEEEQK